MLQKKITEASNLILHTTAAISSKVLLHNQVIPFIQLMYATYV